MRLSYIVATALILAFVSRPAPAQTPVGTDGIKFPDGTLQTTTYQRIKVSAVFDPSSVAAGASTVVSITVTGAATGDVAVFNPRVGLPTGLVVAQTRVNTNAVAVTLYNASNSTLDAPSNTADVIVFK